MAARRYTRDQLHMLRKSPLVQKPDDLPAIEQWLDEPQQAQNAAAKRHPQHANKGAIAAGAEGSPMGNFSTGLRPGLVSRNTGGRSGEDISLGPPRTMFPSSRNTTKLLDVNDKATDSTTAEEQEALSSRSRFFGEKRATHEKEGRDNRDSWTIARERRALGGDDEHRQERHEGRSGRRDRDHDGERRNGQGEKNDARWGEKRQSGDRQGGWRDRDRRDRDPERGGHTEKEPEWMDDPAPPSAEDDLRFMGMPRNQEDFQKWKDAMSRKKAQADTTETPPGQSVPAKEAAPAKSAVPLKLEGITDKPFGVFGDNKPSPGVQESPAKAAPGKSRGSRFASMFKDAQKEDTPPVDTGVQEAANKIANGSAEDEAGFKRILQMLGGTGIDQPGAQEGPSSPPTRTTTNGTRKSSRFTGFFDQAAKSPERLQSPPEGRFHRDDGNVFQDSRNGTEEPGRMFGGRLQDVQQPEQASRGLPASDVISPELPMNGNRKPQETSGRMNDIFLDQQQPPSRGASTPDVNIQNLLASQRAQRPQGPDKQNSEFLLNLLQNKASSRPTSQQQRPENFPLWLDQPPPMPETHAPKPGRAAPPPGMFEDQLLRNAPQEHQHQQHQMPERRSSQRAPPGFYDEQSLFLEQQRQHQQQQAQAQAQQQQQQQQRRNFTEPPQHHQQQQQPGGRRMSGHPSHNLPPMQIPPHQQQFQGVPPEYLQSPTQQGPPSQNVPPGFNPHMRHPPGFHNIPNMPNIFQQQRQQEMPGGYSGGMSPPPNAPPGFYGGQPGPQGMPPPPGFLQQMRSPTEGYGGGGSRR